MESANDECFAFLLVDLNLEGLVLRGLEFILIFAEASFYLAAKIGIRFYSWRVRFSTIAGGTLSFGEHI